MKTDNKLPAGVEPHTNYPVIVSRPDDRGVARFSRDGSLYMECKGPRGGYRSYAVASEGVTQLRDMLAADFVECLRNGRDSARAVVDAWERGDLAGAVNALEGWIGEAEELVGEAEDTHIQGQE